VVARTGSVTRAAAELGYSQSAVTAQIKTLESLLGTRLFDRSRNGVSLTSSGERLIPYATRLLKLADEARADVVRDITVSGELSIGANETITTYHLPMLLERFHRSYPDVRLSMGVYHEGPDALVRAMARGEIDIAFFHSAGVPRGDFAATRLAEEDLALIAPIGHPLENIEVVTMADLRDTQLLVTTPSCVCGKIIETGLRTLDSPKTPILPLGTLEAVKSAIATAGLGVSALPRVGVADLIAQEKVSELPWVAPARMSQYAAWNEKLGMSEPLRALVDLITPAKNGGPDLLANAFPVPSSISI
jgi:DNA-binding transcriptional LysR family regulator